MRSRVLIALACIASCAITPLQAAAQETINAASVSGRVRDQQDAVIPGALVTARQIDTNVTVETITAQDGRFRFPYLKIGPYEIRVHLDGFTDATRTVTLSVGGAYDLPIVLTIRGVDAIVTVQGEAPVLEASRSQIAGTVSVTEAQHVPMNGRNFLDLALLVPGASPTNVGSNALFAETSAVPGGGLSVASQRNFSNNFIVDGLSANDDAAGLSGMPYGMEAIEQFQVVTSGAQAELGRALGGYVNVVTRSGTNATHGSLYEYMRDDRWNAANPLLGLTLPMHQDQFGASLGGPIARNRTFYFGNVEQRRLDQHGLVTITPAAVDAINARLAAVGYPGPPIATGVYPNPVTSTNGLAKVDHQVRGSDQLSVRYALYRVASEHSRGAGALSAATASAALRNVDHAAGISNTWTLSDRTVNETRVQLAYADLEAPPTDSVGPAVTINGVATFGTMAGSPTRRVNTMYQVVDNLSRQNGAHALRAGVDLLINANTITYPRASRGAYTFSSLPNFLSGLYNNAGFTQTFGASVVSQTSRSVAVFAQDEWKVSSRLTLNAGLRYDLQFLQTVRTDRNNLSPRLGFAWMPSESRHTLVRGSAGLFYDRVPLRALANAILSAGNTTDLARLRQIGVSLSPAQAGAPTFPNILPAPTGSVTLPNLTTMHPAMRNAYSRQASVEVEQLLGEGSKVSVGYQYTQGVDLIISVNQNVPSCVAAGANNGCRPIATYANNSQYSPLASSRYNGLHVSFVQRPVRWGHYRVSYALSKAMSNVGEFFFSSPIDPFDLSKDWGRSDDDQRHRLVLNGTINYGVQVSVLLRYYSALPLNITSGVTTVQATAGRPIVNGTFIQRNAGEGPDFFSLSARVSRTFTLRDRLRLDAIAEAFNLTNRTNVVTLNGNFGAGVYPGNPSATFGQITSVGEPRAFQLAVRLMF